MYALVNSSVIYGLEVRQVRVETDVSDGLPTMQMIGFLAGEVKEAAGRVRAALKNSGIYLPAKKIVINLAPADIPKRGALLDLPIAISIAAAMHQIPSERLSETLIIGELGLDGAMRGVSGVLLMVRKAREDGLKTVILPKENVMEASLVPQMTIVGISSLEEAFEFLRNGIFEKAEKYEIIGQKECSPLDFGDIVGQEAAKRCALIAAAGYHNLLLLGPPGSGKTMIANRIPTIMPPMSYEECVELTGIYSAAGLLPENIPFLTDRPYRSPHHTVTSSALMGGGSFPKPGEVTLADHGILFLDEFTEFKRPVLDMLRQPMEEHNVRISRVYGSCEFPADFLLVAAANPCPCGYYPDLSRCHCNEGEIRRYLGKISGPLMDRIDLCVRVEKVLYSDMQTTSENSFTGRKMQEQVMRVWEIQQKRFHDCAYHYNGRIPSNELKRWCILDEESNRIMENAYERLQLSVRSYHRILRVARTIADLDGEENICSRHIAEAIGYRGGEFY